MRSPPNVPGLSGILSTKTLWATHAGFLNDSQEITGFFDYALPVHLKELVDKFVEENPSGNPACDAVRLENRDLSTEIVEVITRAFRSVSAKAQDQYVVSFCASQDEWISRNGLLSQWRAYGQDGAYAIVFDTKSVETLIESELKIFSNSWYSWADVEYRMTSLDGILDDENKARMESIKKAAAYYLVNGEFEDHDSLFSDLFFLSSICKHRGFEEEKEVRIVVHEEGNAVRLHHPTTPELPRHPVHSFFRDGTPVPCVHLFEKQSLSKLPITRVIVGPHRDKAARKKATELLLSSAGVSAEVVVSDIPFRG